MDLLLDIFSSSLNSTFTQVLETLASLVQMIMTHWLNDWLTDGLEIDSPQFSSLRLRHKPVTQNGMALKMEYHSIWNVTQNGMSL